VRDPAPLAIELVTERLHLRPVRAEDAGVAAAIGADERVMEWFGGAFSREKSAEWLTMAALPGSRAFLGALG
jgi:RimJ/RimL family protein N-acetyltransferase